MTIGNVMQTFDLSNRTAVVTGGNRGIGAALARALCEAGATVVIAARNAERNERMVNELVDAGHSARAVEMNVTDPDSVEAAMNAVGAPIDILVNNAGTCYHEPALDVSPERFREVFDVNVNGLWYCSRAAGRRMIEQGGGRIINVGSISALIVNRPQMQPAYNASKAAVHQLTKSLAAEWAPHNVRVNAIAPGYVRTDMAEVDRPDFKRYWIDDTPMLRPAEPVELGPTAVYLASEASSFMTGSVVVIDGGYTLW
ncbi:MAG TPA: glucose 1-dehydrogenase [Gammaproteobacteria bacterium]|nr:glucose 1-dehydrogenase [Gammaproteobacteria bacterium]